MKNRKILPAGIIAFLLAITLTIGHTVSAAPASSKPTTSKPADRTAGKAAKARESILQEAVAALALTKQALRDLDANKPKDALSRLAIVTGKLEILVAAHPELSLAPVDVKVLTIEFLGSRDDVEEAVEKAEDLLEDHKIQEARELLNSLASEIVVRVVNLPLATYPKHIKEIAPLIEAGKIAEAKTALENVLATLVITDHVYPLPVIQARDMLIEAAHIAGLDKPSDADKKRLSELLKSIRERLELAEALGYGDHKTYKDFYDTLKKIEKSVKKDNKQKKSLIDKLTNQIKDYLQKR